MQEPPEYSYAALLAMTQALRAHDGVVHRLITDLGKAHFVTARGVIADYLTDPDGYVRARALLVLVIDFDLKEYQATARQMLPTDPDDYAKISAITALKYVYADTTDAEVLKLLAATTSDSLLEGSIRTYAYTAMLDIIKHDPKREDVALDAIDWAFVEGYR